ALGAARKPWAIAATASGSRGAPSTFASRSKRSSTNWRSCGVIGLLHPRFEAPGRCMGRLRGGPVRPWIKFLRQRRARGRIRSGPRKCLIAGGKTSRRIAEAILRKGNIVCRKQPRKLLTAQESVFAFALHGQRIEADKNIIHQPRMAHDEAA